MPILVVTTIASFMTPFMLSSVNLALPAIQAEFCVDAVALSWVSNAYLLAVGVFLAPVGKFSDMFGKRRMFFWGLIGFTIISGAFVWVESFFMILALRIAQAVGSALMMTNSMAIVSEAFPFNQRGKAIGINVAAVYVGLSAGPFVGGLLTGYFGWRAIFAFVVPVGIVCLWLTVSKMGLGKNREKTRDLDLAGCVLYALFLICSMYGLTRLPSLTGVGFVIAGLGLFPLFIRHELKASSPVIEIRLFSRNRVFAFSSLAALINYGATFAVSFLLSLYLQYTKGLSPQSAGLILVSQPIVQAVLSPLAGRLSDRIEPSIIASTGMGFCAFGLFLLSFIGPATGIWYVVFALLILGLGFALFSSPNMNAIMSSVDQEYFALASGTVATMRLIGQMLSMATAALIFSLVLGDIPITPTNLESFLLAIQVAFGFSTCQCCLGIFFSAKRGHMRNGEKFFITRKNSKSKSPSV